MPLNFGKIRPLPEPAKGSQPDPRKRLVVVEDEADLRQVLEIGLKDRYNVAWAATGTAAERVIEEHRPHLLVLDIHLPGVNGFEICRRLRERPQFKDFPILFLTGRHDDWSRARSRQMGADDYLTKPFDIRELISKISELLGR